MAELPAGSAGFARPWDAHDVRVEPAPGCLLVIGTQRTDVPG